jgi:hypothetical protein
MDVGEKYIADGRPLEFQRPVYLPITTSRILEVRAVEQA